jgi:hypothetical protein
MEKFSDAAPLRRTAGGSLAIVLSGDVDGDRDLDQADVRAVLKLIGQRVGMPRYVGSADLIADGRITMYDIVAVRNLKGTAIPRAITPILQIATSSQASPVPRLRRMPRAADPQSPSLIAAAVDGALTVDASVVRLTSLRRRTARQ